MSVERVGMIGLGLMGIAFSRRILAPGSFDVIGWDTAPAARDAAAKIGVKVASGAGEIFDNCRIVLISLPTSNIVEAVLDAASQHLRGGTIVVDATTGDPDGMAALGARLHQRGVHYLDATIAASSAQVVTENVLVMVGGEAEPFRACQPLFNTFAGAVVHVGPWGSGGRMKLVNNLMLGLSRAALGEAIAFAAKCGLDRRAAMECLRAGNAYSRVMDTKGEKMLTGDFTPQARLSQHLKDVLLILEIGRRVNAKLPMSELHRTLLEQCEAMGLGPLDNSAVIKLFDSSPSSGTPNILNEST